MIRAACAEKRAISVGLLGNAAEVFPELVRRGVRARHRHRPDQRARPGQRLPAGRLDAVGDGRRSAAERPGARSPRAAKRSMAAHVQAMLDFQRPRRADARLRQQHPADGARGGRRRTPSTSPASCPAYIRPLFCRGIGPVPLGGAVRRPRGHLPHRRQGAGSCSRTTRTCTAGSTWPRERISFQGLPARICWVGLGDRAPRRPRLQRDGGARRAQGADRDRPRPPRQRHRSPARTARPKRCATAPTPSPTGRC